MVESPINQHAQGSDILLFACTASRRPCRLLVLALELAQRPRVGHVRPANAAAPLIERDIADVLVPEPFTIAPTSAYFRNPSFRNPRICSSVNL